nr:immunoglobulin heavy chain junction region [Mus musculus]
CTLLHYYGSSAWFAYW